MAVPMPRYQQISLDTTPSYHIIIRCVRCQYLCGTDPNTGRDYSHRREWIRERLFELVDIFAIRVCAYGILSNHAHLVLWVDEAQAADWDDREVARRWCRLFNGKPLVRKFAEGDELEESELSTVQNLVATYRKRLFDISWFMRCLNEPIARRANQEDNVSGHFWESRFKSQALLDEAAIITAMAYVDLNPVRAAMAETLEESDFTSIQQRILESGMAGADQKPEIKSESELPEDLNAAMGKLMPFREQDPDSELALPANLQDYIELVDWTGRCIAPGKRGSIPENLPPILTRLNIRPENYIKFIKRAEKNRFHFFIGPVERIREVAKTLGRGFLKGQAAASALFGPG